MRIPSYNQFLTEMETMSSEYTKLGELQNQVSSGKKIQHASEDPVLGAQILSQTNYLNQLDGYSDNQALAQKRASLFMTSMTTANDTANQVQTLIKQAENGTMGDKDRQNIVAQLKGLLTTLLSSANTRDASGQYIYSGNAGDAAAYAQVGSSYQYQGGNAMSINLTDNQRAVYGESGLDAFGNIPNGNGTFSVAAGGSNTGTAIASPGTVSDQSAYVADNYTISFQKNNAGQMTYTVTGATSGQVIPAQGGTAPVYKSGEAISFNGISMPVKGDPAAGDTFSVQPSTNDNVFNMLQNVINTLQQPVTNKTAFQQTMSQLDSGFAQVADHLNQYMSQVGADSTTIKNSVSNATQNIGTQVVGLGQLQDADMVQVMSAYSQQSIMLQATTASYMKIQDTLNRLLQMQFGG